MELYTARRIRWWKKLKSMDGSYTLSDTMLGELMLDAAKLTKMEKLLVMTSTQNSMDVELIVKALHEQHPTIHREEKQSFRSDRNSRPQPRRHHKGHGKQRPRRFKRHGYVADHQTYSDSASADETEGEYERVDRHEPRSSFVQ